MVRVRRGKRNRARLRRKQNEGNGTKVPTKAKGVTKATVPTGQGVRIRLATTRQPLPIPSISDHASELRPTQRKLPASEASETSCVSSRSCSKQSLNQGRFRLVAPRGSFVTEEVLESGRLEEPKRICNEESSRRPEPRHPEDGADENDMCISKLVCGDGIVQYSGYMLREGVIYGCANAHGGPEQMFELEETTLNIQEPKGKYPLYEIRAETTETRKIPRADWPEHPLFSLQTLRAEHGITEVVLAWLCQNPGFSLRIAYPGARDRTTKTIEFEMWGSDICPIRDVNQECLITALANGVSCLRGRKEGLSVHRALQSRQKLYRSLKAVTDDFLAVCKRVDLVRSCKAQRTIGGLVGTSSGVFVVRLLRGNICDHVVAVDCDRRMILDGVEEHPLRLTAESLALSKREGY